MFTEHLVIEMKNLGIPCGKKIMGENKSSKKAVQNIKMQ